MNIVEKLIYNLVKRNPKIKTQIRDFYQGIMYLIPGTKEKSILPITSKEGYFFGFHDKSPWSFDNKYLLANKFNIPLRAPAKSDSIEIGYFSGQNFDQFRYLAKTKSFNWQQGCMLQWVGQSYNILYNDFNVNGNIARIIDIEGKIIKELPQAIAALSPDGKYGLSYSFERMSKYAPGYGYENGIDIEIDKTMPTTHGLSITDISSGSVKKLFSVKDIAEYKSEKTDSKTFHYFTHCLFSPSNERFVFYHRCIKDLNFVNTRMISCDINGNDIYVFPTNQMVSHIGWKDENHILAYCRIKNKGDKYVLFEDKTDNFEIIGEKSFDRDGHPSFSPANSGLIITDTYPDSRRYSTLILYDMLKDKRYNLAELKQPLKYREELRCDLHPRWNRTGTMVCFDSAHSGKRALCTMDVKQIIEKEI